MIKNKSASDFTGFLDGYRAGNLSAVSPSINLHINELRDLMSSLYSDLEQLGEKETANSIQKGIKILDSSKDFIDKLLMFGESFKSTLDFNKFDYNQNKVNKIVYHYLQIAHISEDSRLTYQALELSKNIQ